MPSGEQGSNSTQGTGSSRGLELVSVLKVMLVNDFFRPTHVGGAEIVVDALARGLLGAGKWVAVATARIGDLAARSNFDGVEVYRIGAFPNAGSALRRASGTRPGRPSTRFVTNFAR